MTIAANIPHGPPAGGTNPLGTVTPPAGTVPTGGNDPSSLVADIIRNGIWLLAIVAFIAALIWIIFAGFRFITAGGDEKTVASAWAQIYWGLIGLVVVVGAFAIIKIVETFFQIEIITNFSIPGL